MGGKEGFDTGRQAINPFTSKPVPIWVANFVLGEYGTGAIMGVPGHDQRDFEFAKAYDLPITVVVQPDGAPIFRRDDDRAVTKVQDDSSTRANSTGWRADEANRRMTADAKERGIGEGTVQYRLKDWGISRQRYWGTPIPVIYCEKDGVVAVSRTRSCRSQLPKVTTFTGRGDSPLAQVPEFVNVTCPKCGGPARRETDTMDTFVDSSWYFLRFCDPHEQRRCRSIPRRRPTGCRSISTAAASSTRFCTCCTRASSRACCATSAWSTSTSRSSAC